MAQIQGDSSEFSGFWIVKMVIYMLCESHSWELWWITLYKPLLIWTGKKLSTKSPWDFEYILETWYNYWVDLDENCCPESTRTRWRCNHFSKKWSKSKFDTTLSIKKPFVTPNFCGWNFSAMHHFWVWIFLSPRITEYLV